MDCIGITNQNSIGIELCVEADGLFKPETIANAVWLGKKSDERLWNPTH